MISLIHAKTTQLILIKLDTQLKIQNFKQATFYPDASTKSELREWYHQTQLVVYNTYFLLKKKTSSKPI